VPLLAWKSDQRGANRPGSSRRSISRSVRSDPGIRRPQSRRGSPSRSWPSPGGTYRSPCGARPLAPRRGHCRGRRRTASPYATSTGTPPARHLRPPPVGRTSGKRARTPRPRGDRISVQRPPGHPPGSTGSLASGSTDLLWIRRDFGSHASPIGSAYASEGASTFSFGRRYAYAGDALGFRTSAGQRRARQARVAGRFRKPRRAARQPRSPPTRAACAPRCAHHRPNSLVRTDPVGLSINAAAYRHSAPTPTSRHRRNRSGCFATASRSGNRHAGLGSGSKERSAGPQTGRVPSVCSAIGKELR